MLKNNRIFMTFIYALRVLSRNMRVFYKLYKSNLVVNFIEPTILLFAFGVGLGNYVSDINGMSYIRYIAPGMVAYSGLFAAAFECLYSTYIRMTMQKTFDAILATPVNAEGVILGEMFYASVKAVVFSAIIMIVVYAARLIPSPALVLALPFIFIGGMTFAGMSMIVTGLVKGMESYNYYITLVISPLMLLSGIFFPLDGILLKAAWFSPFYQTAAICQSLAAGNITAVWPHALMLLIMMSVATAIALAVMKRRLAK